LEVTTTTKKGVEDIPGPKDANQGKFVVDHVLELAVVQSAFEDARRDNDDEANAIPREAWDTAKDAVNGDNADNCKTIAEEISKSMPQYRLQTTTHSNQLSSTICSVLPKESISARNRCSKRLSM
ncbi:MAG: hypothetical protein Q9183_007905, partial [Haloplaca sp. 2 TL-2023]